MDILTVLGVTVITGVLSIMAFYFSFSKKAEGFYEETNESPDATGFFNRWMDFNGAAQTI